MNFPFVFSANISKSLLFKSTFLIFFIFLPQNVLADAYSWIDNEGNKVFGTKPPANAQNVEAFKTKKLSRYSSDKVLKRLGTREASVEEENSSASRLEEEFKKTADNKITEEVEVPEATKSSKKNTTEKNSFKKIATSTPRESLEHYKVIIQKEKTEKGIKIKKCEVSLHNHGDQDANSISVSFAFSDGTFIPAEGKDNLKAGESSVFKINEDLLPLEIKANDDLRESPKVLVNGASL